MKMSKPDLSYEAALDQAGTTMAMYLGRAIDEINIRLGNGYAQDHPVLVAACIQAQTMDFNNCTTLNALFTISDAIDAVASGIEGISDSVEGIATHE